MKKNIAIILAVICMVIVSIAYLLYKRYSPLEQTVREKEEKEVLTATLSTNILRGEKESYLILYIAPTTKPIFISAFDLNLKMSLEEKLDLKKNSVITNPLLTEKNWVFSINKLSTKDNDVFIELSAYHLGQDPYKLEGDIEIARVPLEKIESVNISVTTNEEEQTNLYAKDAVEKIPIKIK